MIVMQVLPALNSGGVERGAIDVANYVHKKGHTSVIVSSGGRLLTFLNRQVKHIKLNVNSKNPFVIYKNIAKIRELIIQNKVNILHVRSRAPAWSCYYAVKGINCKLVSTFHGTYNINSFLKKIYNQIMLKSDKVIAVSNHIKTHIKEKYPKQFDDKKIEVIHRGVDIDLFNQDNVTSSAKIDLLTRWRIPEDKKIIMLPGRITGWKGHEFLVDSLKLLKRSDYLCLFVGDFDSKPKFKKRLENKIINAGLGDKIKFTGTCNNMPVAYSMCDVVISASIEPEAFGRVAIEGQSMRRIVVATNIGGSKETVIDKKTGFLVGVGNVKEMSHRINYALNLEIDIRKKITDLARKNVEKSFSNVLLCSKTMKIYQELIKV